MADSTLRVVKSPRWGLGVMTFALAALASGGTGLLVSHGTQQLQPPAARTPAPLVPSPATAPVVVDRAPGSVLLPAALPVGVAPPTSRIPVSTQPDAAIRAEEPQPPVPPARLVPPLVAPDAAPVVETPLEPAEHEVRPAPEKGKQDRAHERRLASERGADRGERNKGKGSGKHEG